MSFQLISMNSMVEPVSTCISKHLWFFYSVAAAGELLLVDCKLGLSNATGL